MDSNSKAITGPEPPTRPSPDEVLAELNEHPFFMNKYEENDQTEALRALAYEGTPLENARNFLAQGEECFAERKWRDARDFYAQAIDALVGTEKKLSKAFKADGEAEAELLEDLYLKRGEANFQMENFASSHRDSKEALRLKPDNVRAHELSAKSLLAAKRLTEADSAIQLGLAVDTNHAGLKALDNKVQRLLQAQKAAAELVRDEEIKRNRRRDLLRIALAARDIHLKGSWQAPSPPFDDGVAIKLSPDPESPTSMCTFPVQFLYPSAGQYDLIEDFTEVACMKTYLDELYPHPWDTKNDHGTDNVDVFAEKAGSPGTVMRIAKTMSLLRILSRKSPDGRHLVEVVNGHIKFYIVPRAHVEDWVNEFTARTA